MFIITKRKVSVTRGFHLAGHAELALLPRIVKVEILPVMHTGVRVSLRSTATEEYRSLR